MKSIPYETFNDANWEGSYEKQLQLIEILFLEAVHFHQIEPCFLSFAKSITLFAFINPQGSIYRIHQSAITDKMTTKYVFRGSSEVVCMTEVRDQKQHLIKYWVEREGEILKDSCDFSLQLKCEVEIINNQLKSRNFIRVIIKRYCEPSSNMILFQPLLNMHNGKFVYKKNFCKFRTVNEIECPSAKIIEIAQRQDAFSKNREVILCLNQSNLRQLPFFATVIERIASKNKITKIIGHPSSLFLTLLLKPDGKCDSLQRDKILRYKQTKMAQSIKLQTVTRQEIVKGILIRVFSQQNLLNPTLIQFLIDNIVDSEFVSDFMRLFQLYYKIFLREDVQSREVEQAIDHYFYQDQQYLQHHAFSFSCLFNFVQWRHNMQCSQLLQSLQIILDGKTRKAQELTLQDLYNYNGIQFTFIGLDLTDRIVRFFNCSTTPNLPIVALLSLVQFLPTPYKSIYWRQQWGRYRIHYGQSVREINISKHQIVDTRFLLQSPLDLLENKDLRDCYMKIGQNEVVHAVSTARKKATEMPEIEQLKALLKEMKSKAIDAIPKLKLVWKILTTKNRIELDLNNFETFNQIPIIGRFVSLDETFKVYLDNLNREANSHRTIIQTYPILPTPLLSLQKMSSNLNSISNLLSEFMNTDNFLQRSSQDFSVQVDTIDRHINQYSVKSYDEYLYAISRVQSIIKLYPLQGKYRYRAELEAIIENIGQHEQVVDCLSADSLIKQMLTSLKAAKLRVKRDKQKQNDINSSSFMRDTYTPINGLQRVPEKLAALFSEYKAQQKTFQNVNQQNYKRTFIEYEKILYRLCKGLKDTFQRVSEDKRIHKFYSNIYSFTPYLYQLQRMEANQIITRENLKNALPLDIKKIHIVLNGQPNRLIYLGRQLIRMRNGLHQAKISNITSTNYHSVAALLFSLSLDDETFMEELMGLQKLVETHPQQDQSMDLVQMLLKGDQRYYFKEEEESNEELCLKIAKKYQSAFKLLVQLEATAKKTKQIRIIKLYQLIDQYDREQLQSSTEQKQKEIVRFLKDLLVMQKDWLNKAALIRENKEMIDEKMKLNKVGIRFMIRFLYRSPERESNWLNIHLRKYKSLHLYYQHLCQLFTKYNIPQRISLKQFNSTNAMGIHLNFNLINYHRNRYDTFNSEQRGSVKLIDLLIAAVSYPLDFPTRPIGVRDFDNTQKIPMIINKNQKKFIESSRDEAYWSNYGCNSMPFNLLRTHDSDSTFYCSLQFVDEAIFLPQSVNRRSMLHRDSLKTANEQKENLRTLDLLSMWWTKSKKLTREMKEILFGSIFDSPFLYYYYILQNSSYEALLERKESRNLVNLSQNQLHLEAKGRIIGEYFDDTQKDCLVFKLIRLERELSVQVVMIRANLEIRMEGISDFLREGQEYRTQRQQELEIKVYRFREKTLEKYSIQMAVLHRQDNETYYKIIVNDTGTLSMIDFAGTSLRYLPLHCNCEVQVYRWIECSSCGEEHGKEEGSTCSTCLQHDGRTKRGNLNLYLLAYEATKADFQELKDRAIEEVRKTAVVVESEVDPPNSYCCFRCCWKQTNNGDT